MSRTLKKKKPYSSLYITWDRGLILVTKSHTTYLNMM